MGLGCAQGESLAAPVVGIGLVPVFLVRIKDAWEVWIRRLAERHDGALTVLTLVGRGRENRNTKHGAGAASAGQEKEGWCNRQRKSMEALIVSLSTSTYSHETMLTTRIVAWDDFPS